MDESSNTIGRRDLMNVLPAAALGGLIGRLWGGGTAHAQDAGAGVIVTIKETYATWAGVYTSYAKTANDYLGQARSALDGIKTVQEARKYISDQEGRNRQIVNQFYAFGKDPLGATLPNLAIETMPLFNWLSKTTGIYDSLANSGSKNKSEQAALFAQSKAETGSALGKNEAVRLRKKLNELKKGTGKLEHPEKSSAQLFGEQSGPITSDTLQALLECMLRIEDGINDFRAEFVSKTQIRHEKYTADDAEEAKKRYEKGGGTLADKQNPEKKK